jgi:hypothetical protein
MRFPLSGKERNQDRQEIAALRSKLASLESLQESEISRVCVDIAQDRRRLSALEKVEPQQLQNDRGEVLRALIAANGGAFASTTCRIQLNQACLVPDRWPPGSDYFSGRSSRREKALYSRPCR